MLGRYACRVAELSREWGTAAFVLFYLGSYAGWQLAGWGGPGGRLVVGILWFVPILSVAALSCWRAGARASVSDRRVASGWRLIALALVFYASADVAMALYTRSGDLAPFPSIADALYLMFYPLFLAGVSRFPAGRSQRTRLQLGLDAAIVAAGGVGLL